MSRIIRVPALPTTHLPPLFHHKVINHSSTFLGSINVELTIKSMQRQLLQIADKIPDDIMLTLLKSFAKILSREPEPAPKPAPFLRAFAKIRDDGTFSSSADEDDFKDYDSGNEVETFNFKVTTNTEEITYSMGENGDQQLPSIEEVCENEAVNGEIIQNGDEVQEIPENSENIDEGIEVEMPKLLPTDEAADDATIEEEATNEDPTAAFDEIVENSEEKHVSNENGNLENVIEEEPIIIEEEPVVEEEPIPEEPPKVSLDDIQREIAEMEYFLKKKGLDGEKKKKKKVEEPEVNGNADETDPKAIEDAYQVDVCIKLKNREHREHKHHHKKHHHSKYMRSENYKEEIIDDGPIFDPTVPNTVEDFMKVKNVPEKLHKKQKKGTQAFDVSWMNVMESQKKHYK